MFTVSPLPYFDMERFLRTSEESCLTDEDAAECRFFWNRWHALLVSKTIPAREGDVLAIWLDESVEHAVDAAWQSSPSRGLRLHSLAQTICMHAVSDRIPEIEQAGCAPVPSPDPALAQALTEAGLPARVQDSLVLARRYAVITPILFKGQCNDCALQKDCPQLLATASPLLNT